MAACKHHQAANVHGDKVEAIALGTSFVAITSSQIGVGAFMCLLSEPKDCLIAKSINCQWED